MGMENPLIRRENCFKWTRLFLSAGLTLSVSAFTIIYTLQQGIRDDLHREREQQDMVLSRKQLIYDSYFNEVSEHLLSHSSEDDLKTKTYIRSKTLNVLPHLDPLQKTEIILFLYANHLIRYDFPDSLIDLQGADLTGCHFQYPCELISVHLIGILADKIIFEGCQIEKSMFNGSSMVGAQFLHTRAAAAHFDSVNLTNAVFIRTNNLRINFVNAILVGSHFKESPSPQSVNFVNSDLYQSDLTNEQLGFQHGSDVNIFLNTRMPNGSFSEINSSQLIYDGNAHLSVSLSIFFQNQTKKLNLFLMLKCALGQLSHVWEFNGNRPRIGLANSSILNITNGTDVNQCYFQCLLNRTDGYQIGSIRHFSHAIDSGLILFNLSAYFSCFSRLSFAIVYVTFYTEELIGSGPRFEISKTYYFFSFLFY